MGTLNSLIDYILQAMAFNVKPITVSHRKKQEKFSLGPRGVLFSRHNYSQLGKEGENHATKR